MATNPKRLYDMVLLVVPEKDEQAAAQTVDEFRKLLVEHGAVFEKDESMGRRRLAYMIHKKTEATYHNFLFRGDGKCVAEVERKMKISDDVLRYLTVRVDEADGRQRDDSHALVDGERIAPVTLAAHEGPLDLVRKFGEILAQPRRCGVPERLDELDHPSERPGPGRALDPVPELVDGVPRFAVVGHLLEPGLRRVREQDAGVSP